MRSCDFGSCVLIDMIWVIDRIPKGFQAISRWLSEATPPDASIDRESPDPNGVAAVINLRPRWGRRD